MGENSPNHAVDQYSLLVPYIIINFLETKISKYLNYEEMYQSGNAKSFWQYSNNIQFYMSTVRPENTPMFLLDTVFLWE